MSSSEVWLRPLPIRASMHGTPVSDASQSSGCGYAARFGSATEGFNGPCGAAISRSGASVSDAKLLGGFAGAGVSQAIQIGMSRGMLSNEAGLGTAPMAHATANTEHPFRQGMWGAVEVGVDTLIICTITAFAVLSTGVLSSGETGIELVIGAFASVFPPAVAGGLLSFAILTFCLSTQIAFFLYFETAITSLFGAGTVRYFRYVYLIPGVLFAGVSNVDRLWAFAKLAVGSCAIPNLIAVLALSGPFFVIMRDYVRQENRYTTAIIDRSREYVQ